MTPARANLNPGIPQADTRAPEPLSGDAIALAEKLVARLPPEGGVVVLASVSPEATHLALARQLTLALQLISSRPALLVEAGASGSEDPGNGAISSTGLTDVLSGRSDFQTLLPPGRTGSLATLGYGTDRARAAELIISESFREFLKTAQGRFNWVVLRCPELMDQRHAASLVARANSVVVTVKAGSGRAGNVRAIQDLCQQLNRSFAGVILT